MKKNLQNLLFLTLMLVSVQSFAQNSSKTHKMTYVHSVYMDKNEFTLIYVFLKVAPNDPKTFKAVVSMRVGYSIDNEPVTNTNNIGIMLYGKDINEKDPFSFNLIKDKIVMQEDDYLVRIAIKVAKRENIGTMSVLYGFWESLTSKERFENNYTFKPEKKIYQKSTPEKIDSLLRTTEIRPFNGICLVAKKDKIEYLFTNGFADRTQKTPFTNESQFIVGSLSKQITAVLILQACEKGKIDLNTSIKKYLPDCKATWADSVTVHQLLNHTSGVVGFERPLAFQAGKGFSYSNTGYALLGQIAAAVNKTTYEKLVKKLFKKCKMAHSAFPTKDNIANLCTPYLHEKDGTIKAQKHEKSSDFNATYIPAAGLMTTPEDLLKWNTLLHNGKLLNADFYTKMTTATTTRNHPIFGDVPYGYALQMAKGEPYEIGHGGYASGFVSINFYYPKEKISLIVLENLDWQDEDMKKNFWFETEVRAILRLAIGK